MGPASAGIQFHIPTPSRHQTQRKRPFQAPMHRGVPPLPKGGTDRRPNGTNSSYCSCRWLGSTSSEEGAVGRQWHWDTDARDGGWTTPRMEGYQWPVPTLQELLGPMEITCIEERRAGTSLEVGRRKEEDGPGSHPPQQGKEDLAEMHGCKSGGHLGVNKTIDKVRQRYYWLHLRGDVEMWCQQCDTCAASRGPRTRSRGLMHQYNVGLLSRELQSTLLGLSRRATGETYLLVAMDYFTKWPEVYAIPNQEASTMADALVTHFFFLFGVPIELHSDQSRNFESWLMQEVLEWLGWKNWNNTPTPPVRWDGGTVREDNRGALAEGCFDPPTGLGWEATHLPADLPDINPRDHRSNTYQHGVREGASPALRPDVRGSSRQGTVNNGLYSRSCWTATRHSALRPTTSENSQRPNEGTLWPAGQLGWLSKRR